MTFGAFISTKRKESKLNLRDTAKHLGIAYGYLCDIEQGRHPGSRGKICRAHLFTDYAAKEQQKQTDKVSHDRERKIQETMLGIKKRYGKNAILKGMNFEDGATAIERNQTIGGHHE